MLRVIFLFLFSIRLFAYEFEVSIATVFRDEARFLKEWIEFHKLIGVEHFYLYNHCSQDNFQEVLDPYIREGVVELFNLPTEATSRGHWFDIQRKALHDAVKRTQGVSKWVAFIDADEFIFPVQDKTLPKFLSQYEQYGAVTVNWRVFGTSNIQHLEKTKLMIEQLIFRSKDDYKINHLVKCIVQVNYVDTTTRVEVHIAHLIEGRLCVNSNKEMISSSRDKTCPNEKIRIHHYMCRDKDFLYEVKLKRPDGHDPKKKQFLLDMERDSNEIEDRSILIYAEALKRTVFE